MGGAGPVGGPYWASPSSSLPLPRWSLGTELRTGQQRPMFQVSVSLGRPLLAGPPFPHLPYGTGNGWYLWLPDTCLSICLPV